MIANLSGGVSPCPEDAEFNHHVMNVCADYLEGEAAYSVTFSASLFPRPAEQQVAVFRYEGEWRVRMAGFSWQPGASLVEHRRNEMPISDEEASQIIALMNSETLGELAQGGYYGPGHQICLDGARLQLAAAKDGQVRAAARHSCAGKTELNEISDAFRQLALKYDPAFEGMLSGLAE